MNNLIGCKVKVYVIDFDYHHGGSGQKTLEYRGEIFDIAQHMIGVHVMTQPISGTLPINMPVTWFNTVSTAFVKIEIIEWPKNS